MVKPTLTPEERLGAAEERVRQSRRYTWLMVPDSRNLPAGVPRRQKVYVSFWTGELRYTLDGFVISRAQAVDLLRGTL